MTELVTKDLHFAYDDRSVLRSLNLTFPSKELIGIVGPNGCGKSTLVSLLANLRKPTAGQVLLHDRALGDYSRNELARKIAYLPQSPICPEGITVEQVLRYGRQPYQTLFRQFSSEDADKIAEVVSMLHLGPIMQRPIAQLSGGQRQKVWIGMVLVQDTDIILLDEPTSALDIGHQFEVLECIRTVCNLGKTIIMVIHDLAAAARFCDHILALKDGALLESGRPKEVITESLIESLYGVRVEILKAGKDGCPVIFPVGLPHPLP